MKDKLMGIAIAVVVGVVLIGVLVAILAGTNRPATTVCAEGDNLVYTATGVTTLTLTALTNVHRDPSDGGWWCSNSATAPTTFSQTPAAHSSGTLALTLAKIKESALPLGAFPGTSSLLVIIPLVVVGGLLYFAMRRMRGGGGL